MLLVANIISFVANAFFTIAAIFKSKNKILITQSVCHGLSIATEVMTSAYGGLSQDSVSLVRNIGLLFIKNNKKAQIIFSIVCVVVALSLGITLNILLNDNVWYGYLPVMASFQYSVVVILAFVIKFKELNDELIIKISLIINSACWSLYGFFVKLYPIMGFNIVTAILSIISIIIIFHQKKLIKFHQNEIAE